MNAGFEQVRLFDFLCEHTPSKSRVMALIGTFDIPRSLAAVLTCKDKAHAHAAQRMLRRVLAARDATEGAESLRTLVAALPDAPGSSLRQAVAHAATGTWPAGTGILYVPVPEAGAQDEELEGREDAGASDEPDDTSAAASPDEARLKDLAGSVVRIAHLREFHITDEDTLVREAMSQGWEPLPASDLTEDDPRDLVGAVMTLSDSDSWIAGAETLTDQSSARLLRVQDGDELADWSARPIRTDFTHGWRLGREHEEAAIDPEASTPTPDEETPDLVALFPVRECDCGGEGCEEGCWQFTPRTVDLLLTALSVLADQAYDDAEELGDRPVSDHDTGNWETFMRLPPLTFAANREWRRRMARAFDDLADDLERGTWPQPSCTAEEMALHLAIEDAPSYLDDIDESNDAHGRLPEHEDDYDWDMCSDLFFQDHDVLMLFNARFDGIEDPAGEVNQHFGIGDLRRNNWFEPFGNTPARDPGRGFRR
ncbi:hypothetical protein B4N89_00025 [Embleya scabrispora]|uniref:Uncharacterized protein n=1 Tax=Embleya scabrispora TaxID=159449 RepID=A0A1T3NRX4_9ACTN|nr:hypothetical protein [Embleya scabrispora]OPC79548.1 hypothetical protein B4N89_00025 [Embleya scabrispora]